LPFDYDRDVNADRVIRAAEEKAMTATNAADEARIRALIETWVQGIRAKDTEAAIAHVGHAGKPLVPATDSALELQGR
jgi:hypothetical protein